ncbi:MAG: chromosome segregation protein SMC [Oscillospiraceae bacterium]|nr:chromosome segregation protein SMC [Oscillospiraceae bacterium]
MHLKALEIQGFKSFPDKVRLSFDEPVTAIVGPNGSGKSNISDALCWVMGEQSARTLRSGKMEDVIFGGTQKRPQMGYAQVSLILDNSDGLFPMDEREIMVTRRYYRSGESEYYINKQAVRLRDVNELFMDTGLGRDGYSVIGQGKIDDILSKKSGERREIFEEAAGISKYRYRKEEAERKLRSANDNLVRINDKISELELQVEPLRRQAEEAKRYLEYRDELKILEAALWSEALERIERNEAKNRADFEAASQALDKAKAALETLYAEGEELTRRMGADEVAILSMRDGISAREVALAELESSLKMTESLATANAENEQRILAEMERESAKAKTAAEIVAARRERIAEIECEIEELAGKLTGLEESSGENMKNAAAAVAQAEGLRARRSQCAAAISAREAELAAMEENAQGSVLRGERVMARQAETAARLEKARRELGENNEDFEDARSEADEWAKKQENRAAALKNAETAVSNAAQRLSQMLVEKNSLSSRAAMLRDMEKGFDGYGKAVKTVMQSASNDKLKGIHGPVSRLVRVDEKYTVAIETALGGAMQNIVTTSRQSAKTAMEFLRDTDAGRATFLPMDAVKGVAMKEDYSAEPGFIAVASELVRFDERYAGIMEYLLGRTLVVENLALAVDMGKKYNSRLRIVTLDGQMLNPGGSMTGGSVSRKSGDISRANELEKILKELSLMESRLQAAEKAERDARRAREQAAEELENARVRQRFVDDEVASLKARGEALEQTVLQAEQDAAEAENEAKLWQAELAGAEPRKAAVKAEIEQLESEIADLDGRISESAAGREQLEEAAAAIYDKISAVRSSMAALEAEKTSCLGAIADFEVSAREYEETGIRQSAELEAIRRRSEELETGLAASGERLAGEREALAIQKEKLRESVNAKLQLEARKSACDREAQDASREIINLEREYARLEQKQAGGFMEEKHILDRMWETYGLTRSAAKVLAAQLENTNGAKTRAAKLKNEMSAMGNPNLGAIEEFQRVNERYTFLTTQRTDAETARDKLEGIIAGITRNMQSQFVEKFHQINESFQATFLDIFGGGSASVSLEDPNDVLGCGIEIKVQPPGKQVKSISLLSGGERAFIAIALYFAIIKVRPTPFCIMDEIETALDEVNTVRCAKYLRKMARNTQFIVITHRRPTIEEADVLYGVAMQEQGVSKVLSLRLGEMEKELGIS